MPEVYCGPAPEPHALLVTWNADPIAFGLCALLLAAFLRAGRREERLAFSCALVLLLLLFVSPLCALTVALFSARAVHHVLLVAVVAPLLARAFPAPKAGGALAVLVAVHAGVLWFWHAPRAYEIGIATGPAYWAMQASLLASAVLLWRAILAPAAPTGAALLALLATGVQMGMLGALLTFAREPLYAPHAGTTFAYGLTPLADQQLAGLVMWVPAALPYLLAALLLIATRLDRSLGAAR